MIRPFTMADAEACHAIFRSNVPLYFRDHEFAGFDDYLRTHALGQYWVVENENGIVGCGGIAVRPTGQGDLCFGLIRQDLHKKGLGRKLTEFRLQKLIAHPDVKFIAIHTSQHTTGFYERFGFKLISTTENAYGPGLHRKDMRLELPKPK